MSTVTLNQTDSVPGSRIISVGAGRPDRLVPNDELVEAIDSSDEWIRQRTGIVTRQRADAETSLVDLAVVAGQQALERAGLTAADLGAVIVSTVTFPFATPSAAAKVAHLLGATPAPAYDISAACAGYCYGVAQADALVRSGVARYVLVIGAEKLSDVVDPTDRSISFLLGDGAGAVIVGAAEEPGIGRSVWGSEGERWDTISMTHSQLDMRDALEHARTTGDASALVNPENKLWPTLRQDGPSVFRWAVWSMAKVAQQALDAAGVTSEDLSAFIPHQANMRIIDEFAKQLKLPESVVVARDIAEAGNTSAASIPLAMHRLLDEHPELSGTLALQIGFGAGLVYGAQVVRLP
ncbi:MAG: beta-ketoacyl-ACP synthase III [Micrococcaceae bacterium]